jgi:transposase
MDRQTLSDWVHRYNATGIDGLKSCHGPGATPLLNEAEKAELKALVVRGPDPEKDKIIRWRCLDLGPEPGQPNRKKRIEIAAKTQRTNRQM